MTAQVKEKLIQKLGEAGLIFLLMGGVIWFLYQRMTEQEDRIYQRMDILEQEVKECNESKYDLLLDINKNTRKVIEENTKALNRING